jgi:UDP-N-acetyl-D-galactosamine dehydrogenase
MSTGNNKIGVIGMGYVGLPVALGFASIYNVVGFDINKGKIALLKQGIDPADEISNDEFKNKKISFSRDINELNKCNFFVVAVPTPVDQYKVPDLNALKLASESVGSILKKGDYVVYESTVYPGCTEEVCVPILEAQSGLKMGKDFKVGYSPERINPGDKKHTLAQIVKVVSGNDPESAEHIAATYASIISAGVYKASSIRVAEASKIIENTQRDVNIALMNELAIIFDKLALNTNDVLEAARTKWNFLNFYPGLVGGHCIGVDPYYLTYKSQQVGYEPHIILSGRKINDTLPQFIVMKILKILSQKGKNFSTSRALIKGITFKENVTDIRNSKVVDLINELREFAVNVDVIDAMAKSNEVKVEYNIELQDSPKGKYDILIVAVAHKAYRADTYEKLEPYLTSSPIIFDIRGVYANVTFPKHVTYLTL